MFALGTLAVLAGLWSPVAQAVPDDFDLDLEGYYRNRSYSFRDLYDGQEEAGRYMLQRLRVEPVIDFEGRAKFITQVDLLDDVTWGDNQSESSTALFAGSPNSTSLDGSLQSSVSVKRAWMEFALPVGLVKFGRQPSNWGLGLLANNGDGFDDSFGENHGGSTNDRIVFATRPIAIAQTIAGTGDSGIPLFVAIGVDRLVEEPLIEYYGFKCESGLTEVDEDYESLCDEDGDGTTDVDHGFTDDSRTAADREDGWWADNDDDVMEVVYVLIYKGQAIPLFGALGDLTAGVYAVHRLQNETNSDVWVADAYLRAMVKGIYAEAEALTIQGTTEAIAIQGAYIEGSGDTNPLYKDAKIWGYVARLGYVQNEYSVIFETGYASGDDNVADETFTGRPLHADYNVGLLLYEEILSRVTSVNWTSDAEGLWSKGGVYNSRYIFPNVTWRPMDNWEIIGAYLVAWPDKPDGNNIQCAEGDGVDCALYKATADTLGWEIDLAIKHRFHNHVMFALESGLAQVTDRLPLENVGLNPDGRFVTVQTRMAYEF